SQQLNIFNRWKFDSGKRVELMFGVKGLTDDKQAGQTDVHAHHTAPYKININTKRGEAFFKGSYNFPAKPYQSIGLQLAGTYHLQDGLYGLRNYHGEEDFFYSNLIFQSAFGNTKHTYRTGLSFMYDDIAEQFAGTPLHRVEQVPGAFFEYTF